MASYCDGTKNLTKYFVTTSLGHMPPRLDVPWVIWAFGNGLQAATASCVLFLKMMLCSAIDGSTRGITSTTQSYHKACSGFMFYMVDSLDFCLTDLYSTINWGGATQLLFWSLPSIKTRNQCSLRSAYTTCSAGREGFKCFPQFLWPRNRPHPPICTSSSLLRHCHRICTIVLFDLVERYGIMTPVDLLVLKLLDLPSTQDTCYTLHPLLVDMPQNLVQTAVNIIDSDILEEHLAITSAPQPRNKKDFIRGIMQFLYY